MINKHNLKCKHLSDDITVVTKPTQQIFITYNHSKQVKCVLQ